MFANLEPAPPDAIFGLNEAFQADPRPGKINLGAGVYKDERGTTPIFDAVKQAERRLLDTETSKSYLPIEGSPEYTSRVLELLLGEGELLTSGRAVTLHAPGGTGALRLAADFVRRFAPEATMWISEPTWPNHPQIADAAGLGRRTYGYFDPAGHGLDFGAMLADLGEARPGDVVVLHGCCHNPTGVDPTPEQWQQLAALLAERQLLPLVDFAYQGFAAGLREDTTWLPVLAGAVPELLVASSYSKNFGLYNERVGALTAIATDSGRAAVVRSQLKRTARALYSNPPAHGGAIVATVLGDDALRQSWTAELEHMRQRIHRLRSELAAGLDRRGVELSAEGNAFMTRQNGMFSFTGLDTEHVEWLKKERGIYLVGSGRINVAGIREDALEHLCDAIAEAMGAVSLAAT